MPQVSLPIFPEGISLINGTQPRQLLLEQSPRHQRFTMVFDREGYSPALLQRLRDRHIACPLNRDADGTVRKAVGELHRKQQQFAALQLSDTLAPRQVEAYYHWLHMTTGQI
ncbi:MAG: hypothetical protein BWK76_03280 [Desulfobulbaceae bacterium A2]|nr:MAG: hypothetical protein BWK76_03280 [Desulfobulbaceae bacterium A2]